MRIGAGRRESIPESDSVIVGAEIQFNRKTVAIAKAQGNGIRRVVTGLAFPAKHRVLILNQRGALGRDESQTVHQILILQNQTERRLRHDESPAVGGAML